MATSNDNGSQADGPGPGPNSSSAAAAPVSLPPLGGAGTGGSGIEVWYAIPSANPESCRATLPAWRKMGYRVAVLQNRHRAEVPADVTVWVDSYPGWAASVNLLASSVVPAAAPIIVTGGDDMLPDPNVPAGVIAEQFLARFPDTFGVMQPQGDQLLGSNTFCGSPWLGRAFCARMYGGTGPMFPGYRHNWADNELFWVARCMNVLWTRSDLSQRHEHFSRTGAPKPDYWEEAVERTDRMDAELFIARSRLMFPGHAPIGGVGGVGAVGGVGGVGTGSGGSGGGAAHAFDAEIFAREYHRHAERYWVHRYARDLLVSESERLFAAAIERAAKEGKKRVAVFGAGTHTRSLAHALMRPALPIVCIIDDNPELVGTTLWNYPVVSVKQALTYCPDAVVLSSQTSEHALAVAAEPLADRGAKVYRLYSQEGEAVTPAGTPRLRLAS